jgi:hypothetical protein
VKDTPAKIIVAVEPNNSSDIKIVDDFSPNDPLIIMEIEDDCVSIAE